MEDCLVLFHHLTVLHCMEMPHACNQLECLGVDPVICYIYCPTISVFSAHFLSLCLHLSQGPVVSFGALEKAVAYLDLCSAMSHVYILQGHSELLTDSYSSRRFSPSCSQGLFGPHLALHRDGQKIFNISSVYPPFLSFMTSVTSV